MTEHFVVHAYRPEYGDDVTAAIIYGVAVRRPWRRQGLGEALIRNSFAAFQARGLARAVPANETHAAALYERAGIAV
jgi:ribosomal protein S18 acetylase RimI-like enzyme